MTLYVRFSFHYFRLLDEKNQELELKVRVQEHLKTDLKNKNNEIATLERKIRQIGLVK